MIEDKKLLLPHIQRPFVWKNDQVKRFFDSILRDYPFGTLLFWTTKDEIQLRRLQVVTYSIKFIHCATENNFINSYIRFKPCSSAHKYPYVFCFVSPLSNKTVFRVPLGFSLYRRSNINSKYSCGSN